MPILPSGLPVLKSNVDATAGNPSRAMNMMVLRGRSRRASASAVVQTETPAVSTNLVPRQIIETPTNLRSVSKNSGDSGLISAIMPTYSRTDLPHAFSRAAMACRNV